MDDVYNIMVLTFLDMGVGWVFITVLN